MLSNVYFFQHENLPGLTLEIEELVASACPASKLVEFREELEGWWSDQVYQSIIPANGRRYINFSSLAERLSVLRRKYSTEELYADEGIEYDIDSIVGDEVFLQQIDLLGDVKPSRRVRAESAFLKAGAQRGAWLRKAQISPEALESYDEQLLHYWETRFDQICDDLSEEAGDEVHRVKGREIFGWVETADYPLRGASATFLTPGSLHLQANELKVGWHPKYLELLSADGVEE